MNQYSTIKIFSFPSEAYVLKSKLESEGVDCFLKDELTIQANPFYSNAIGGVKLQVKTSDFFLAEKIMKQNGFSVDYESSGNIIFDEISKISTKIPLLNKIPFMLRISVIYITIAMVLMGLLFLFLYYQLELSLKYD